MKRTYQPNNYKMHKKHGWRKRMSTKAGQTIIKNRRRKNRSVLTK